MPKIESYTCPNPSKLGRGCACPQSSTRCYASIRAVREAFNRNYEEGGIVHAVNGTLADLKETFGSTNGWSESELLRRFMTITRVQ